MKRWIDDQLHEPDQNEHAKVAIAAKGIPPACIQNVDHLRPSNSPKSVDSIEICYGLTVLIATRFGLPISKTQGLLSQNNKIIRLELVGLG